MVVHPSYDDTKAAVDGAVDLIRSKGVTVLRAMPIEDRDGWKIQIDTANPLPKGSDDALAFEGIGIKIHSEGLGHLKWTLRSPLPRSK